MAFMKRKTVKFAVDIQICHLSDVPLVNAVVFAKIRLLDGGSYEGTTERVEVNNHGASFSTRCEFSCRIPCDQSSGTLEKCFCRVSIRKEQKGGKSFYKLGYIDINLSEFAASGVEGISRIYLLNGYTSNQRLDNSKVCVKVTMCHQSADPFFRIPRLSNIGMNEDGTLNPEAFRANDLQGSDPEEIPVQPKISSTDLQECTSAASSSSAVDEFFSDKKSASHGSVNQVVASGQLRRFSQDRSVQKIQHTRFDPENVIDGIIAECRISEELEDQEHPGLSLEKFLDKHGKPIVGRPFGKKSYTCDQYKGED